MIWVAVAIYVVGYFITAGMVTRRFYTDMRLNTRDDDLAALLVSTIGGLIAALVFPILALGFFATRDYRTLHRRYISHEERNW